MKSIELFSGAGGLALGLEQAGFSSTALFERDADACNTLRENRKAWNVVEGDACGIGFSHYGPVALVAGGPPCQPFSMGGKARGFRDRRDMFPVAIRAVRELRPEAFIFENVRGLLRSAFANYVEFIRLQLIWPDFPVSENVSWETNLRRLQRHHTSKPHGSSLAYNVAINLVDAADYGVPQHRHRVFFVGFRRDLDAGWSFPKPTHFRDALLRAKYVTKEYWSEHGIRPLPPPDSLRAKINTLRNEELLPFGQRWRTVRDAFCDLPAKGSLNHCSISGARAYPGHTGSEFDEPSKALKAGAHGVPGGENMLRNSAGGVRYYTVRESARIQTFPDDYIFPGSWTESMRQLGNAVPVELARIVAASVAAKLKSRAPKDLSDMPHPEPAHAEAATQAH
jgi:DNA (cytosine-5)-methyltransferase 1